VDFLPPLKIQKTHWPVTYIMALVVVLVLSAWWFSVKPEYSAYNFLPENTSFYYQWSDREWQLSQPTLIFSNSTPQAKITDIDNILDMMMGQVAEVIWFQIDNQAQDNYLIRFIGNLTKQEIEYLAEAHPDWRFERVNDQILLLTQQESLLEQLPIAPVDKFLSAQKDTGQNIYFNIAQAPEFLAKTAQYLETVVAEQDIFLHLTFDGRHNLVDVYYIKDSEAPVEGMSWSQAKLPRKFQVALAMDGILREDSQWLDQNLITKLFSDAPNFDVLDKDVLSELWQQSLLIKNDENWLWVSHQDWQENIFALLDSFDVKEVSKTLPDGTLYTEFVKNKEVEFEYSDFVEQTYWRMDDLFGVQVDNLYYLSNSEDEIKQTMAHGRLAGDMWAGCGLNTSSLVTDWTHLEAQDLNMLDLGQDLLNDIKKIDIFAYQNHVTAGFRLCFE
jgi:hypothetical protein